MSKVDLIANNFFLILLANFAFFSLIAVDVYGINYSYETPASKILLSDKSYEIPIKINEHDGLSSIEHVKINLNINDFFNTTIPIKWSQIQEKEFVIVNENKLVKGVTVTSLNHGFLEFKFKFIPTQEIELRSITVDILEHKPNDITKSSEMKSQSNSKINVLEESTSSKNKKDQITQHGIGRNTGFFDSYRQGQQLLAEETFNMLVGNKNIQNEQFGKNYNEHKPIELLSRSEDPELRNAILKEIQRAEEFFNKHFYIHYNFKE